MIRFCKIELHGLVVETYFGFWDTVRDSWVNLGDEVMWCCLPKFREETYYIVNDPTNPASVELVKRCERLGAGRGVDQQCERCRESG